MGGPNVVRAQRHEETAAQVVAEDNSVKHVEARTAIALGHGERGGHDRTAGVRLGDRLEIVGLVRMAEHRVRQGGVDCRGSDVRGEDGSFRDPTLSSDEPDHGFAGFETRARDHRPNRVEDPMLAFADDVGWKISVPSGHHVAGQPACDVGRRRWSRGLTSLAQGRHTRRLR